MDSRWNMQENDRAISVGRRRSCGTTWRRALAQAGAAPVIGQLWNSSKTARASFTPAWVLTKNNTVDMEIQMMHRAAYAQSVELSALTLVEGIGRQSTVAMEGMEQLKKEIREGKHRKALLLRAQILEVEGMKPMREVHVIDALKVEGELALTGYRRVQFRRSGEGVPVRIEIHPSASRRDVVKVLGLMMKKLDEKKTYEIDRDELCPASARSVEDSEEVIPMPLDGVVREGATNDWPDREPEEESVFELSEELLDQMNEIRV